jgi:hypothetical protein
MTDEAQLREKLRKIEALLLVRARSGRSSPLKRRSSASAPAWSNWSAAIS